MYISPYLSIPLLGILFYHNTLFLVFTFDDSSAIVDNVDLRPETLLWEIFDHDYWGMSLAKEESHKSYRPVTVLTFRFNYFLHELEPFGYHLVNLLLHIGVCLLYFHVVHSVLEFPSTVAYSAALLFVLHPIHTEAVAGIVGRAELLCSIWFLLTIWAFARIRSTILRIILTTLGVILATFSKEQGITVLGICCIYQVWFHPSSKAKSRGTKGFNFIFGSLKTNLPKILELVVIGLGILLLRVFALKGALPKFMEFDNPAAAAPIGERQLTFNYLLPLNCWLLLCPDWLCADWTMGTVPLLHGLTDVRNLATVAFYFIATRIGLNAWISQTSIEGRRLVIALVWIVFPFLPASNLLFPVGFVVAERVLYIPSMGYCILISLGYWKLQHQTIRSNSWYWNKLLKATFWMLCLTFAAKTYVRNWDWENDLTLFQSGLKVTNQNAKIFNNIGHFLEHKFEYQKALPYFLAATQVQPNDLGAWVNVGRTYNNLGRIDDAEIVFLKAKSLLPKPKKGQNYTTRLAPSNMNVFLNLGNLYKNQSKFDLAEQTFLQAINMLPTYTAGYLNVGDIYMSQEKYSKAREIFLEGVQHNPNSHELHYNLGILYAKQNKKDEALAEFKLALSIKSTHFESLVNSAYVLADMSEKNAKLDAIQACTEAIGIRPYDSVVHQLLGTLLYETGDIMKAEMSFENARSINPQSKQTLLNLGLVQAELGKHFEAFNTLKSVLSLDPSNTKAMLAVCELYVNRFKKLEKGLLCYNAVLNINPKDIQARHNLCILLIDSNQTSTAIKCVEEAEKLISPIYTVHHVNVLKERFNKLQS